MILTCMYLYRVFSDLAIIDPAVVKVFHNSEYTFSSRLYGNLDVDLTHIKLPQPLPFLIQQPSIYIRGNLPKLCFQCLMKINEVSTGID